MCYVLTIYIYIGTAVRARDFHFFFRNNNSAHYSGVQNVRVTVLRVFGAAEEKKKKEKKKNREIFDDRS